MPYIWNIIKNIVKAICFGIRDSCRGFFLVFHYDEPDKEASSKPVNELELTSLGKERAAQRSKHPKVISKYEDRTVKDKVLRMCKVNSIVFGSSLIAFYTLLLPALNFLGSFIDDGDESVFFLYIQPTCFYLFHSLWLVPMLLIMKIVNCFWCQDVAYNAYWQRQGKPQSFSSLGNIIADLLFATCIQCLVLVQAGIIRLPLGVALPSNLMIIYEFVHMALLNSYYAFEYSWIYCGWNLDRRLNFVEKNWAYFLGFGSIPAFVTLLLPSVLLSGCLFAVLFPFFLISANEAMPFCADNGFPLRVFMPSVYLTSSLAKCFFKPKNRTSQSTSNRSFR